MRLLDGDIRQEKGVLLHCRSNIHGIFKHTLPAIVSDLVRVARIGHCVLGRCGRTTLLLALRSTVSAGRLDGSLILRAH